MYLRQRKLPLTSARVEEVIETVTAIQERRLRHVIAERTRLGLSLFPSRIQRAASLRTCWRERIKALLGIAE